MLPATAGVSCTFEPRRVPVTMRCFFLMCWTAVILALGLGCTSDRTPSVSDDPDVVAAYQGGVVRRSEFDSFEYRELEEDPQVAVDDDRDWRAVNITEIVLHKILEGESPEDGPDPMRQSAIEKAVAGVMQAAMTQELGWNQLTATMKEVREQYDSHPEQYYDPEKLRLQHIYLRAEAADMPETEREEVRQKLEGIRQEILAGADFVEMARQHSQSASARAGGWMTLKADGDVFPAFAQAAWALEAQEVSEVIDTPTGFQLAKMIDRIPVIDREFEDVIEFARRRVLRSKLDAAKEEFIREAGPRYGLEQHYERLSDPFIPEDEVLITVGEKSYRFRDLTSELTEHYMVQLYNAYFPKVYKYLDEVTLNRVLVLEAERLGLSEREEVAAQIDTAVREVRYKRALYRRLQRKVSELPEAEIREYFQQNEKRYQTLRTTDLDVILLKPETEENLWQTLKRGEDMVRRIRAGEDFADLARAHSSHYSAANGGRMERLTNHGIARWVQPRVGFQAGINELAEGEVMDAVVAECYDPDRLRYFHVGVIIVRLVKSYPPEQQPFETVKEMARGSYMRRHFQRLETEVRQKILESIDLKIYFDHLPPI